MLYSNLLISLFLFIVRLHYPPLFFFFFFNDTATTEIYTLSLHDALPISAGSPWMPSKRRNPAIPACRWRSEEHTSELQSHHDLVCRLLLEKKKKKKNKIMSKKNNEEKTKTCQQTSTK